jgi:drug/metabolite transporter (DMT)-like permease
MRIRLPAVLGAASVGWGMAAVGVRAVFAAGATTFTVVVVRTGVATAGFLLFAAARRKGASRLAWWHGSLIGVLRIGVAPILFIASLNFISAGFEGLVITLVPLVTAALAHVFLGERLQPRQTVGLLLGLAGTSLLIGSGESGIATGGNTAAGGALALGGVLFGSISGVLSRSYAPRHDTTRLALPMFVSGALTTIVGATVAHDVELAALPERSWGILIALGLGSTLLPFVATLWASRHTTATNVALVGYVAPLISVVAGALLLDEVITGAIVVGGLLTLSGVALVTGPRARPL